MPTSIARAMARSWSAAVPRTIRPPTAPQPKPSSETGMSSGPKGRFSIGMVAASDRCDAADIVSLSRQRKLPAMRSDHVLAAVCRDRGAGDEAGVVAGQEHDAAPDLLGLAQAPDRDQRQDALVEHLLIDRTDHLSGDVARADRVDRDTDASALLRQRLGEPQITCLCRRVIDLSSLPFLSVNRRDVDDTAKLPLTHARPDRVRHVEEAVEVGTDNLVPLLARHAVEHRVAGDPGVIH